jgi:integrase
MATVALVVIKNEKKQDNTYRVKIRISHQSKSLYIETSSYVDKSQLDKKLKIKDHNVLDKFHLQMKGYRDKIADMSMFIKNLTVEQVRDRLLTVDDGFIDFIKFSREHLERLKKQGKETTARTLRSVVYGLIDYFGTDVVPISSINYNMLVQYSEYLKQPRTLKRKSSNGVIAVHNKKGMDTSALSNRIGDLRILFNAARDFYNDEDNGILRIPHYPFKKFKINPPTATKKRNLSADEIKLIRDSKPKNTRGILARDIFMLSFYMCGMNAIDIYRLVKVPKDRLEYKRTKTKDKRKDEAFISIKVIDEAMPLLKKYVGKIHYKNHILFDGALNMGFKEIEKITGIERVTMYYARHSFATLARNECRFTKDDVAMALNHYDASVTDVYIAKDWKIVDDVQEGVANLLR